MVTRAARQGAAERDLISEQESDEIVGQLEVVLYHAHVHLQRS